MHRSINLRVERGIGACENIWPQLLYREVEAFVCYEVSDREDKQSRLKSSLCRLLLNGLNSGRR